LYFYIVLVFFRSLYLANSVTSKKLRSARHVHVNNNNGSTMSTYSWLERSR